jgi:hypothetical protein
VIAIFECIKEEQHSWCSGELVYPILYFHVTGKMQKKSITTVTQYIC